MTPAPTTERPPVDVAAPIVSSAVIVTAPAPAPPAARRVRPSPAVLVTAAVVLGVAFRVGVYARNPSLWIDEAMLAVNVVDRTPAELLEPLELNQGAPLGFLWTARAVVAAFGPSEYALRAVPLAAAVAGFLLFVALAYRVLPLAAARLAVVLFAFSPYLVGYAAEFKQYELDAAITVGLLALGRRAWEGTASRRDCIWLAVGGAVAVWFSHPAVFVLGGVGTALLATRRPRGRDGLVVAAWLVSFAACYLLFLRKLGQNAYLTEFWAGTFLPLPPVRPGDWAWLVHHVVLLFDKPGGFGGDVNTAGLAAVCALIGGVALARTDRRLLVALAAPFAFALAASAVRKYPFAGRLMLFAVPLALLLVAHGAVVIADRLRDLGRVAWWLVVVAVCVSPANECNHLRQRPLHAEASREILAQLGREWRPGDRVYVTHGAAPAFRYYRPPVPPEALTLGREGWLRDDLQSLAGAARVWVAASHFRPEDEAAIRAYLDCAGVTEVVSRRPDAVLVRCDPPR